MATAAAVDFGSFSSPSGSEWVPSNSGSRTDVSEFADSRQDQCSTGIDGIVGSSPALRAVLHQVKIVATTGTTVMIEGETGTGKELIAHAIHTCSDRRGGPS